MSTFIRIFVGSDCVHEAEVREAADVLRAMEENPPPKANGCSVYIAGPRRLHKSDELAFRMTKVAGSWDGVTPFVGDNGKITTPIVPDAVPTWRSVAEVQR